MHIFSGNAFSQNKNKFLCAFYKQIIDCQLLEKIIIYYHPNIKVLEYKVKVSFAYITTCTKMAFKITEFG